MVLQNSIPRWLRQQCVCVVPLGCVLWSVALVLAESQSEPVARVAVATKPAPANDKLANALDLARSSLEGLKEVKDYEATFTKREVVRRKVVNQTMHIKVREEPFSVYLRFVTPHEGREVIFVEGKHSGQLLAHGTGLESLAGTVKLDPKGNDALKESRYPITMVGMANMTRKVVEQWESEAVHPDVEVTYYPNAKLGNVECIVLQTTRSAPKDGVKFHMTRLYLEKDRKLPIRVEQYGFPPEAGEKPVLLEEYTYLNVQTNLKLTDGDFDTSNPAYDF